MNDCLVDEGLAARLGAGTHVRCLGLHRVIAVSAGADLEEG